MTATQIYDILIKKYTNAESELVFNSTFELLVAVILSAQCTDKRVNQVTQVMFKKYNTPQQFASMKQEELEKMIFSCGFYHNKAKNIIAMSKQIVDDFGGEVPNNIDDLQTLAGVGRKTANLVYGLAFNGDAIAVDTHVFRVSNRLRLSVSNNVLDCEKDLMKSIPKNLWTKMHFLLVLFGRYQCKSQRPLCENCEFQSFCKYYSEHHKN